jgi:hypothetical protein
MSSPKKAQMRTPLRTGGHYIKVLQERVEDKVTGVMLGGRGGIVAGCLTGALVVITENPDKTDRRAEEAHVVVSKATTADSD